MSQFTPLEMEVLEALLAGDHPVMASLRQQLSEATVQDRRKTGAGFFTKMGLPSSVAAAPTTRPLVRLGDVLAEIEGLKDGAGFVLTVADGLLDELEGYSFEEPWPDEAKATSIEYTSGAERDLAALDL